MSVKFWYSSEKTNSYRPTPWHWSTEQFSAYRGNGWRHRGFLSVAKGYEPAFGSASSGFDPTSTKLIKTKGKGTLLLVPCSPEQDEQVMLITLRGGFRGGYSRIKAVGCEVLFEKTSGGHCVVTGHLVVRLTHPNGYVFAETGRRCSTVAGCSGFGRWQSGFVRPARGACRQVQSLVLFWGQGCPRWFRRAQYSPYLLRV